MILKDSRDDDEKSDKKCIINIEREREKWNRFFFLSFYTNLSLTVNQAPSKSHIYAEAAAANRKSNCKVPLLLLKACWKQSGIEPCQAMDSMTFLFSSLLFPPLKTIKIKILNQRLRSVTVAFFIVFINTVYLFF